MSHFTLQHSVDLRDIHTYLGAASGFDAKGPVEGTDEQS